MTLKSTLLFTGVTIGTFLLLNGCGSSEPKYIKAPKPHKIEITGDINDGQENADIWHKFVTFKASYQREQDQFCITVCSPKGISDDVTHFQIYIDADMNTSTGFTDTFRTETYALEGVDYMIEDGILFASESNTEWKWKALEAYSFQKLQDQNRSYTINTWGSIQAMSPSLVDIQNNQQIKIAMEPVDSQWQDTHNYVMPQTVEIKVQ